ncbi:hypothetical protein KVR01_001314 [Diaporthe batatas]|uniref:uncharacterized protein n=1 Tax=Diaporthe batatas TaxID=748121 RepID=UPI001D047517|nr:uncharacterized protein KVR01_001314 [Diaporthe batatas]KAG8168565.1 hypothetical protein KVR01_001314 [Diaporthe batatas]
MTASLDVLVLFSTLAAGYLGCLLVYNVWLHPLSKYPGPFFWRAFRLPFLTSFIRGRLPHDIKKLHEQYGDIVRLAPDEISFIDSAAWRDIYPKNFVRPYEYKDQPPGKTASNLIACTEREHARFRRILAPAFSERYTAAQEPIVSMYVDKLVSKLNERIDNSESTSRDSANIDAVEWINYVAFDIVGDLVWGSSFGCLEGLTTHPWIQTVSQFKAATIVTSAKFYPWLYATLMAITPSSALNEVMEMWRVTEQKVRDRIATGSDRPDILSQLLECEKDSTSESMTREEMEVNAMMLVAAGSESVTTVLSGLLNYLLRNPKDLAAVTGEVRTSFSTDDRITGSRLKKLPLLNAVLNEGMRLCPTIPDSMRRNVPPGGATVAGEVLPPNTVVSVPPWASYRAKRNFNEPERFMPARWLSDSDSGLRDDKAAFNPFSLGPHNCPGQNLAWLELRLILAKLLWAFDLSVASGIELPRWEEQGIWWFWEKQPTVIRLTRPR